MVRWRRSVVVVFMALLAGARARGAEQEETRTLEPPRVTPGTGATQWVRQTVSPSSEGASSVAQDTQGNVISLIVFEGDSLSLETGPLPGTATPGRFNSAVVKHAPDGRLLWGKTFGVTPGSVPADVVAQSVAVDWKGNITFLASFGGTVDFGGGPLEAGEFLGFALVKLDRHGHHLWSRLLRIGIGEEGSFWSTVRVASDGLGNVAVTGAFSGIADFGAGPVTMPGDSVKAFLARFSSAGAFEWLYLDTFYPGSVVNGVTADKDGNLILVGAVTGLDASVPYVRKMSPRGELLWSRTLEAARGGSARDVAVHGNRVVVVGQFFDSFVFAGQRLTAELPPGGVVGSDMFVVAYTTEGGERWARHFAREARAVAMDQEDGVRVLGFYEPGDEFGNGPLGGTPERLYPFVMKLDRIGGETLWVHTFGEGVSATDLSVSREGAAAVVGDFFLPVDLGTGTLVPHGPLDAFILKLAP